MVKPAESKSEPTFLPRVTHDSHKPTAVVSCHTDFCLTKRATSAPHHALNLCEPRSSGSLVRSLEEKEGGFQVKTKRNTVTETHSTETHSHRDTQQSPDQPAFLPRSRCGPEACQALWWI